MTAQPQYLKLHFYGSIHSIKSVVSKIEEIYSDEECFFVEYLDIGDFSDTSVLPVVVTVLQRVKGLKVNMAILTFTDCIPKKFEMIVAKAAVMGMAYDDLIIRQM
jgi:hypothetical protein